jgi:hypothetical protein
MTVFVLTGGLERAHGQSASRRPSMRGAI